MKLYKQLNSGRSKRTQGVKQIPVQVLNEVEEYNIFCSECNEGTLFYQGKNIFKCKNGHTMRVEV